MTNSPCHDGNLVVMDPDGDIILTFGNKPSIQILVSSGVFQIASPVFQALFLNNFKEGCEIAKIIQRTSISLPEDNPQTMYLLYGILHHRRGATALPPLYPSLAAYGDSATNMIV
jgi:hypothetical protein